LEFEKAVAAAFLHGGRESGAVLLLLGHIRESCQQNGDGKQ
jgi:hypothetical protein